MKNNIIGSIVACSLLIILHGIVNLNNNARYKSHVPNINKYTVQKDEGGFVDAVELDCLSKNLYFEAGNQKSDTAMLAVGYTVINRVNAKQYPDDVCGVVYQGRKTAKGNYVKHQCQFSWVCDGKRDVPNTKNFAERKAWARAQRVAYGVLTKRARNPIGKSTMYHATYVNPYWVKAYKRVVQIESHIFYKSKS